MKLGIRKLDYLFPEIPEGSLFLISGKERSGKSTFKMTIAKNLIHNWDHRVMFVSPLGHNSTLEKIHKESVYRNLGIKQDYRITVGSLKSGDFEEELGKLPYKYFFFDDFQRGFGTVKDTGDAAIKLLRAAYRNKQTYFVFVKTNKEDDILAELLGIPAEFHFGLQIDKDKRILTIKKHRLTDVPILKNEKIVLKIGTECKLYE